MPGLVVVELAEHLAQARKVNSVKSEDIKAANAALL
jgi:hypothetical protein